jgi:hypothetical protein
MMWKQLRMMLTKMYWLHGLKSKLCTSNKIVIYKAILKPVWTYGIHLRGTASTSHTQILECLQSKTLHMIFDAPWYVLHTVNQKDLQTLTVKEENCHYSSQYSACLGIHPNDLVVNFMGQPNNNRQLRRLTRFFV